MVSKILHNRNINNIDEFLNPSAYNLIQYNKLINIDKAAQIVKNALISKKHFKIFLDVDCDGCSSGAIMYRYLLNFTNNIDWIINQGKEHGLQKESMDNYCDTDILIIVDSLNSDMGLYKELLSKNIQIIVLDHHMINNTIDTDAITLVSSANQYPNKQLSGSGVTWKFCMYLDKVLNTNYAMQYVDLATSGIISDMCDVSEDSMENRYICDQGFKNIKNLGLKQINGNYAFDSTSISFGIAPLINAACRSNQNKLAANVFLTDNIKDTKNYILTLKRYKEEQKNQVKAMLPEIIQQTNKQINSKVIYIQIKENFELAGLIGNKLLEKYQRPVLVLHSNEDRFVGSCRGIGVSDFKNIVEQTKLCSTAGHENAFGIKIKHDDMKEFSESLKQIMKSITFKTKQNIDVKLNPENVSNDLIKKFKSINQITGNGFKPINVMVDGIQDYNVTTMSNGKHLKIETPDMDFIKWNFTNSLEQFDNTIYAPSLSFIGTLDSNWFRGVLNKQMIIDDYKIKDGIDSY